MTKSVVPLGHSSMNCNLARARNNIHIASEIQVKSPLFRRLWVCHSCFPTISIPRCLCFPIICLCLVEMLPLMFDLKRQLQISNHQNTKKTTLVGQTTKHQEAKLVVAPQPYQTCPLNGWIFDDLQNSQGFSEFKENGSMETNFGKITINKSTMNCQLHFPLREISIA